MLRVVYQRLKGARHSSYFDEITSGSRRCGLQKCFEERYADKGDEDGADRRRPCRREGGIVFAKKTDCRFEGLCALLYLRTNGEADIYHKQVSQI